MKRIYIFIILLSLAATCWYACKRADNEPIYPASPISRLYVSFSEIETSDTPPYNNISVIDPADSANFFPSNPYSFHSQPNQGMGILFDPYLQRVYQVSRRDSSIRSFSIAESGTLSPSTNFRDTVRLHSARAIRYNRNSDHLIVSDDYPDTPSIQLFYNPTRLAQQQTAQYRAILNRQPWGMTLTNDADSGLMVSMVGGSPDIWEFRINDLKVNDAIQPWHRITIQDASNIRGLAYSKNLDILLVADASTIETGAPGEAQETDGKVYIIENAKQALASGGTINPTRTITGVATNLRDPVDVAIDDRNGRTHYIYVADRAQRRIYRFPIDANGNSAPNAQTIDLRLTIEFIYLDARGGESAQNGQ